MYNQGWGWVKAHVQELLVDLLQQDLAAGLRGRGRNAGAHEASAKHGYDLHQPRLQARVCDARHLPLSVTRSHQQRLLTASRVKPPLRAQSRASR